MPWITEGHPVLAAPGQRLLFVQENAGTGFTNVHLSYWWQRLLAKYDAPFKLSAMQLRHVFVDERCGADASTSGPGNLGAARVMGNR